MTGPRRRLGRPSTIRLSPQGERALRALQHETGLCMGDLCNLGLIAMERGWVEMPPHTMRKDKQGKRPVRLVEWTF
jgi:hypothetical protein